MPDEKPEQKSVTDNEQENPPEERKETPPTPKAASSAGARGTRSKEDAVTPKPANETKPTDGQPPKSDKSPATEKPPIIPPPPPTSLYVVEVDNKSGVAIRIEHLDEKTGERKELTNQEYKRIFPYGRPGRRPAAAGKPAEASVSGTGARSAMPALRGRPAQTASRATFSTENTELVEAYCRGVADYIKALTSVW